MSKLYIKTNVPLTSVEIIIDRLFKDANGLRVLSANPTYTDEECTITECVAQRRSFEDLLTLARTYFSDTTEKELMQALVNLDLRCWYCPDIFKMVFFGTGADGLRIGEHLKWEQDYLEERKWQPNTYPSDELYELYEQTIH